MDSSASSTSASAQTTATTNAAAIADLLGNPTDQQQPVGKNPRRGWLWFLLFVPLLLGAVFFAPRLLEFLPDSNQTADFSNMPLYTVERRDMEITVTEEGSLVSDENVDITCDVVGGATIIWLVDDGARVTEGMEIVKLDAYVLIENATAQKIAFEKARALMIQADKDYAAGKIAVEEYREGLFRKDLRTAESNVTAATERLQATQNTLAYGKRMFRKGYITPQQLEAQKSALARAELDLGTAKIALEVLTKYTKPKMTTELESIRDAAEARLESEKAALGLELLKLERLESELEKCTIKAPQDGLVIYANTRSRDRETEIKEGLVVKERQVILQLPDLTRMRADVEVHESKVDEITLGMPAIVRVQDLKFQGVVTSVANRPESNWFSTAKKYIVGVRINKNSETLRPGFTAEATIIVSDLKDVIAVPVAAVIEDGEKFICAARDGEGFERRVVTLGKSDDRFVEIVEGLEEGEQVFLNPGTVLEASLSREREQRSEWSGRPERKE
ncbi:HlyD family efflux transporter periplasmic adaptor subunit [bacterium]|nr:HlyD family efflux transporter periplasmic adaptor subunit [bacterium]